jgi:hypothetical protein
MYEQEVHGGTFVGEEKSWAQLNKPFWAKILSQSGKFYSWREQDPVGPASFRDRPGGRFGSVGNNPIYEANSQTITINSVHRATRAYFDPVVDWTYLVDLSAPTTPDTPFYATLKYLDNVCPTFGVALSDLAGHTIQVVTGISAEYITAVVGLEAPPTFASPVCVNNPTGCCPSPPFTNSCIQGACAAIGDAAGGLIGLPTILHATFTVTTSPCGCWNGFTVPLLLNMSSFSWASPPGTRDPCTGYPTTFLLQCLHVEGFPNFFQFQAISIPPYPTVPSFTLLFTTSVTGTCYPPFLQFTGVFNGPSGVSAGCSGATIPCTDPITCCPHGGCPPSPFTVTITL